MNLFDAINPVFYLDDEIQKLLKSIDRNISTIHINDKNKRKYLIKKSKVRSIYSSLSIENNPLSLSDVEKLINDKNTQGNKRDMQEVKNAIKAYNHINEYNYKSEKDFIKVHQIMTEYFNEDNDGYRNHGEGVKRNNKITYVAPESILVPSLMKSLFDYLNTSNDNLLVLAAIFHYYFVSIHPFSDGNGRIARFWVSLILISYDKRFEFIPIEEEIRLNIEEYYKSIEMCHINSNVNVFIKFLLKIINNSIIKFSNNFILNELQNRIIELINNNNRITQTKIAEILNANIRTIKRHFKILEDKCIIERIGSDKNGFWNII